MGFLRTLLGSVHLTALGVWVGALGMTAAFAAVIFPEMRDLAPELETFSGYPKDHWVIAAGRVMARVFSVLDSLQIGCATLATLAAGALVLLRDERKWIRLITTLIPTAALVWYVLMVAQPMHADLTGFWDAALRGDVAAADAYRASFDELHPVASRGMGTIAGLALLGLALGAWRGRAEKPA